jgi:hypothetical protein
MEHKDLATPSDWTKPQEKPVAVAAALSAVEAGVAAVLMQAVVLAEQLLVDVVDAEMPVMVVFAQPVRLPSAVVAKADRSWETEAVVAVV